MHVVNTNALHRKMLAECLNLAIENATTSSPGAGTRTYAYLMYTVGASLVDICGALFSGDGGGDGRGDLRGPEI